MAIVFRAWGSFVSGTTSAASAGLPAGGLNTDTYVLFAGNKPFGSTPTTIAQYPQLATAAGAITNGNGLGSPRSTVFAYVGAGSTYLPTVSTASGSPTMARQCSVYSNSGSLETPVASGGFDDTVGAAVSVSGTQSEGFNNGDLVLFALASGDNAHTVTAIALSVGGVAQSVTVEAKNSTTSGNDGLMYFGRCVVSGITNGATGWVLTGTSSNKTTARFSANVVRIREAQALTQVSAARSTLWNTVGRVSAPESTSWHVGAISAPLVNTAEGGTDGVTATTENSGGASGDAFTVSGTTNAPVFSTAAARNGGLGYSIPTGTSAQGALEWALPSPDVQASVSFWFNTAGTPGADIRVLAFRNSTPSNLGGLYLSPARKLRLMVNTSGYAINGIESPTLTPGSWYLVQLAFKTSQVAATGAFDFKIYGSDLSLFHSASGALPAAVTATGLIDRMWLGRPLAADYLGATYFDDIRLDGGRITTISEAVVAQVSSSASTLWNAIGRISASESTLWNVRSITSASRSTAWNVSRLVAATRSSLWNVLTVVLGARSSSWNARALVGTSRSTLWHALSRVAAASRSTLWNVVDTTSVARAMSSSWNALCTASAAPMSTSWGIRSLVTDSHSTSWGVRSLVSAARSSSWSVRRLIVQARSTSWHVVGRIAVARSTAWNVAQQVAATRSTSWGVRRLVSLSRSSSWNVRQAITAARSTLWTTLVTIATARSTSWGIRSLVTHTRSTLWNTIGNLATVSKAMSTSWKVVGRIGAARSTSWNTRSLVAAQRSTAWRVRAMVPAAVRSTSWHVYRRITAARGSSWSVFRQVTASRSTLWETRALVERAVASTWHVIETITGSLSTSWRTLWGLNTPDIKSPKARLAMAASKAAIRPNSSASAGIAQHSRATASIKVNAE